jgi:hypothetical protein
LAQIGELPLKGIDKDLRVLSLSSIEVESSPATNLQSLKDIALRRVLILPSIPEENQTLVAHDVLQHRQTTLLLLVPIFLTLTVCEDTVQILQDLVVTSSTPRLRYHQRHRTQQLLPGRSVQTVVIEQVYEMVERVQHPASSLAQVVATDHQQKRKTSSFLEDEVEHAVDTEHAHMVPFVLEPRRVDAGDLLLVVHVWNQRLGNLSIADLRHVLVVLVYGVVVDNPEVVLLANQSLAVDPVEESALAHTRQTDEDKTGGKDEVAAILAQGDRVVEAEEAFVVWLALHCNNLNLYLLSTKSAH